MDIILQSERIQLDWQADQLLIIEEGRTTPVHPGRIERLWIQQEMNISTTILLHLAAYGVEIFLSDEHGERICSLNGLNIGKGMPLRKRQLLYAMSEEGMRTALGWIRSKQMKQLDLIEHFGSEDVAAPLRLLNEKIEEGYRQDWPGEVAEAQFGKLYFQCLRGILPDWMQFQKRTRRPATDAFSACLNYGYGILYPIIQSVIMRRGLDPWIGIIHRERLTNPVLVFDLIEYFRPNVEGIVLQGIFDGTIMEAHFFERNDDGVGLNPKLKKWLSQQVLNKTINANEEKSSIWMEVGEEVDLLLQSIKNYE